MPSSATASSIPVRAALEGQREFNPPLTHPVLEEAAARQGRFLDVQGDGVVVNHVKPAEDRRGMIVRLINLGEQPTTARIAWPGRPEIKAWRCSTLEEDRAALPTQSGAALCELAPRQIATLRIARNGRVGQAGHGNTAGASFDVAAPEMLMRKTGSAGPPECGRHVQTGRIAPNAPGITDASSPQPWGSAGVGVMRRSGMEAGFRWACLPRRRFRRVENDSRASDFRRAPRMGRWSRPTQPFACGR